MMMVSMMMIKMIIMSILLEVMILLGPEGTLYAIISKQSSQIVHCIVDYNRHYIYSNSRFEDHIVSDGKKKSRRFFL